MLQDVQAERMDTRQADFDRDVGGGLPAGCLIEVVGRVGVGKTLFALYLSRLMQERQGIVVFADTEYSISERWLERCGVKGNFALCTSRSFGMRTVEDICEGFIKMLDSVESSKVPVLLVVDTLTAAPSNTDETEPQGHTQAVSVAVQRVLPKLRSNTWLLVNNQSRFFAKKSGSNAASSTEFVTKMYSPLRIQFLQCNERIGGEFTINYMLLANQFVPSKMREVVAGQMTITLPKESQ